ncbi:MAG: helix-turn-helix domain-containing protein [Alphaproteobacteria bacterium]|nr:helix-turn-helix domain-containing protein [Alphaproteobacteria bacterium]
MAEGTVAAGVVRGLMTFAASNGASERALAERSEIDPEDLEDQDNRIPFPKYVALMRAAKELCNDPALALHFGEAIDLSELSIVGLIGGASETRKEAFAQVNRYHRLVIEIDLATIDRFALAHGKDGLWMVDNRRNPNAFPELTESTFARMVAGGRRLGEAYAVKAIHFTHAAPDYRAEYDRIFQAPVTFESDKNAFLIDVDDGWMTRKLSPQPRYVFGVLSRHADELLKSLESSKTTRGRVESLLMPILHTGDVTKDKLAAKLGMSRDVLLRRLKAEGTTFEKVLDELRHKLALHYLTGKKVSVNETAYLVGFSDPAAFSRAFKRWTGASPRTMRAPKVGRD